MCLQGQIHVGMQTIHTCCVPLVMYLLLLNTPRPSSNAMPPSVLLTHPATTYLEAMQCFYARKSPPHLNSFAVVHSFHIGSDNDNLFTFFPSLSLWTVTNLNLDFETGPTIFRPASTGTRTEIEPLFDCTLFARGKPVSRPSRSASRRSSRVGSRRAGTPLIQGFQLLSRSKHLFLCHGALEWGSGF